jgi:hypothetical protein
MQEERARLEGQLARMGEEISALRQGDKGAEVVERLEGELAGMRGELARLGEAVAALRQAKVRAGAGWSVGAGLLVSRPEALTNLPYWLLVDQTSRTGRDLASTQPKRALDLTVALQMADSVASGLGLGDLSAVYTLPPALLSTLRVDEECRERLLELHGDVLQKRDGIEEFCSLQPGVAAELAASDGLLLSSENDVLVGALGWKASRGASRFPCHAPHAMPGHVGWSRLPLVPAQLHSTRKPPHYLFQSSLSLLSLTRRRCCARTWTRSPRTASAPSS